MKEHKMDINSQIIERFDRLYIRKIEKCTYTMQIKGSSEKTITDEATWKEVMETLGREMDIWNHQGKSAYDEYMKKTYPGWYPEWEIESEKK